MIVVNVFDREVPPITQEGFNESVGLCHHPLLLYNGFEKRRRKRQIQSSEERGVGSDMRSVDLTQPLMPLPTVDSWFH